MKIKKKTRFYFADKLPTRPVRINLNLPESLIGGEVKDYRTQTDKHW